jgi:hypothetical protein
VIPARILLATGLAVAVSTLAGGHAAAQQQPYPQSSPTIDFKPAAGKCLTPDQQKVNEKYNSLNRPTQPGDDQPFWDPEYLVGTWDVDLRTQESPFGPGGESVGTLTMAVDAKNPCLYQGTLTAEDPEGKTFTRTITARYEPVKKILTWTEKDSRGYTIVKQGPIGGELGGLFHHHFGEDNAAPATTLGGKSYRFKGVSEMSSPAFFKTDLQISENGQPFKSFGRIQFEKQIAGTR